MAVTTCRDCSGNVSDRAAACPHCGAPVEKPPGVWSGIIALLKLGVGGLVLWFWWSVFIAEPTPLTPEEEARRQAEMAERAAAAGERRAEEQQASAEERRKGFHCLSGWDGSHRDVKLAVRDQMRNPPSFEHIETRVTPVDDDGMHGLVMRYRAENGFGGMTDGIATARYSSADCTFSRLDLG